MGLVQALYIDAVLVREHHSARSLFGVQLESTFFGNTFFDRKRSGSKVSLRQCKLGELTVRNSILVPANPRYESVDRVRRAQ